MTSRQKYTKVTLKNSIKNLSFLSEILVFHRYVGARFAASEKIATSNVDLTERTDPFRRIVHETSAQPRAESERAAETQS